MQLLHTIERHLRNSGTPRTRFGREAVGDPAFVGALRNGRVPRQRTVERVEAHITGVEKAWKK